MGSKKKGGAKGVSLVGLAAIVAATQAMSFSWVTTDEAAQLGNLVETNPAVTEGRPSDKHVATRATAAGIEKDAADKAAAAANGGTQAAGTAEAEATKPSFKIEKAVPIPAVTGRGRVGGSIYPFDALEVGDSFFVDKPAKNLASTVSSANARYSELLTNPDGSPQMRANRKNEQVQATRQTRTFIVRSVKEGDKSGSRIWRKS